MKVISNKMLDVHRDTLLNIPKLNVGDPDTSQSPLIPVAWKNTSS